MIKARSCYKYGGKVLSELVECYSSVEYAERPAAVWWEERRLVVDEILDCSWIPEGKRFRVSTTDHRVFELIYNQAEDFWAVRLL